MGSRTFTLAAEILVWNGADKTHRKFLYQEMHFILEKFVSLKGILFASIFSCRSNQMQKLL
jgi:hypothetical protein